MVVESVSYNNTKAIFSHKNDALIIQLSDRVAKDSTITFIIQYHGIPAGGLKIGATKYGDRSFFNENWPNNARHWLPTIDHPYDKATSEFKVTAPSKYKVVSNGLLLEESTIDKENKLTHWKQSVPVSSWLFVLGVAEFAVQHVGKFDGKDIQTWVYPRDREKGFIDFAEPTKQVLQFYTDYVGPYAYEKLANIQSPSVSGGMETSSAIFYGENMVTGKYEKRLRNVVIHEIAHQWFGNAVTESTWDDAWLSEGFATFFSMLFQEHAYGHEEFVAAIKNSRKSVYNFSKKDSTYSIVAPRSAETDQVTTGITYQKGAWVLHMLREKIGHDNFRKGIQAYYAKYFNANATSEDFKREMEKVSGQNLTTFFNQWLYKPENLKISAHWEYDSNAQQILLSIKQSHYSGFVFDFPIEIEIFDAKTNSTEIMTFTVNTKEAIIPIKYNKNPSSIKFDPRTVLLAEIEIK
jgi:aminopeptidase N